MVRATCLAVDQSLVWRQMTGKKLIVAGQQIAMAIQIVRAQHAQAVRAVEAAHCARMMHQTECVRVVVRRRSIVCEQGAVVEVVCRRRIPIVGTARGGERRMTH